MCMFKKIILACGILSCGYSGLTHADDMQKFYDDGYDLMLEFRKCSTIKNQLGVETLNCINKSEKAIQAKIKAFEVKHKISIQKLSDDTNILIDKNDFVNSQKQNCQKLYPAPLQPAFKNQIKSCQVQVDLNRYMYVANTVLGN